MKLTEKLKHKYALSDNGAKGMIKAFVAVTLADLVLMLPVGLLYMLSSYLLDGDLPREKFGFFIIAIITVLALIALTASSTDRRSFRPISKAASEEELSLKSFAKYRSLSSVKKTSPTLRIR